MAIGKKLSLYLLVRVLMDLKCPPEGNSSKRWWPGCVETCRCPSERAEGSQWFVLLFWGSTEFNHTYSMCAVLTSVWLMHCKVFWLFGTETYFVWMKQLNQNNPAQYKSIDYLFLDGMTGLLFMQVFKKKKKKKENWIILYKILKRGCLEQGALQRV